MADLVSRLRAKTTLEYDDVDDLMLEAANEIERLAADAANERAERESWQAIADRLDKKCSALALLLYGSPGDVGENRG